MSTVLDFLLEPFQYHFMKQALLAILLTSMSCAIVGVYTVLRKLSFIGGALTHSVLPGVVWAHMQQIPIFWGAFSAGILSVLGIGWISSHQRIRADTAIGIVLTASFSLGLLMMSLSGSFRNFEGLLLGNILAVRTEDLALIAKVTLCILGGLFALRKEITLSSFDPEYAAFIGVGPQRLHYLLLFLIASSLVCTIYVMGVLLATAFLITPAASACLLSKRLSRICVLSVLIAFLSGLIGLYVSYYLNVSAGAAIALSSSGLFLLCWLRHSRK